MFIAAFLSAHAAHFRDARESPTAYKLATRAFCLCPCGAYWLSEEGHWMTADGEEVARAA